jgi:hypothetical protein
MASSEDWCAGIGFTFGLPNAVVSKFELDVDIVETCGM